MSKQIFKTTLQLFAFLLLISATVSCQNGSKTKSTESSVSATETIPDSVVQFLITAASNDFRHHRPPVAIDFRNVKIGFIASPQNGKLYVLCGEFLSEENKEWSEFTTIKTSGYEHYLGKTTYCQDATFVLEEETFSSELKSRLNK